VLFTFRFRIEFFDLLRLSVARLQCELIWAIRLSAATFVALYGDRIAPYLESS
jgi:hypothetical protein